MVGQTVLERPGQDPVIEAAPRTRGRRSGICSSRRDRTGRPRMLTRPTLQAPQLGWLIGAALFLGAALTPVSAQWAVVNLHPEGPFDSYALSVQDGQQVGYVRVQGSLLEHACVWSGTAASWVDLHPAGATQSRATA